MKTLSHNPEVVGSSPASATRIPLESGSMSIVGVEIKRNYCKSCRRDISGRISCTAEEDSISEIAEITHSEADPFQDFGLVVAAFNKTV